MNLAMKRAEVIAKFSTPQGQDENGNPIKADEGAMQMALAQLDDVTAMPSKRDESAQIAMMQQLMQQNAQMMQHFAAALTQLADHMAAPTEIVRDPRTGKVVGSQKRPPVGRMQ
jgi:hypothetical protein